MLRNQFEFNIYGDCTASKELTAPWNLNSSKIFNNSLKIFKNFEIQSD